ncbi:5-formyltetrahydrofolate cyclo-ligase [Arenibaculum pallidiluteum]|uniref:5-formyltetrahydrofolate cyclo-ligase n=1 Tax=Arenibaculum pallidiluteum TaxID=2812559 RepID=UPI001A95BB55|nr:5-formyltetrahydrofolate cyclo-ligase [Arenibaculum pallidiluteum]
MAALKRTARAAARRRRAEAARSVPDAADRVREHALAVLPLSPGTPVSGYCRVHDELDPLPLMLALNGRGATLALPVAEARGRPLKFRRWSPGDRLAPGALGIPEPLAGTEEVSPRLVLVPMLAFDRRGGRLGYGAGFYDRTLAELRARGPVLAVGLAYAAQEADAVPCDGLDEPLDWIVTETEAIDLSALRGSRA